MDDVREELRAARTKATQRTSGRVRTWLRALHRDAGYLAVGLTLVYALSGLAVNHIADWDPNFQNTERTHELGAFSPGKTDDELAAEVAQKLAIDGRPKEVYRLGDDALEVLYEHRTLHVNTQTGHVVEEEQKPRFLIRVANFLHLNRGKKAWTYFADGYAAGLLFLAISGLFMIPGKKGLLGRGAVFLAIGVAIPVLYVTLSK